MRRERVVSAIMPILAAAAGFKLGHEPISRPRAFSPLPAPNNEQAAGAWGSMFSALAQNSQLNSKAASCSVRPARRRAAVWAWRARWRGVGHRSATASGPGSPLAAFVAPDGSEWRARLGRAVRASFDPDL